MQKKQFPAVRAFARVDTAALASNFGLLAARAAGARVIAVVKANAYGHGVSLAVPPLLAAGCRDFAVATLGEALAVRALAPDAMVLILGYTPPDRADLLAAADITQTVFSLDYARALAARGRRIAVHIKIDGGMCRLGFSPRDTRGVLAALRAAPLVPTGIYTHFPVADTDPRATRKALTAFLTLRGTLAARGYPLFAHAAASAALLTLSEVALDGVRVGLSLYGLPPVSTDLSLTPVLSLHAPVVQIHRVPTGTPVGYGGDFITRRPSRIGTLPVGYADGFVRAMQGFALSLTCGKKSYPLFPAGRICMDQMTVDLTDTPARVGDTVTLWQDARAPAAHLGTIPYEILAMLSPRVTRIAQARVNHPNPP